MKNNKCVKCRSRDILVITGAESGSYIQTGKTLANPVRVTRYVCCQCGYMEEWVDSTDDISKLKKKYGNQ